MDGNDMSWSLSLQRAIAKFEQDADACKSQRRHRSCLIPKLNRLDLQKLRSCLYWSHWIAWSQRTCKQVSQICLSFLKLSDWLICDFSKGNVVFSSPNTVLRIICDFAEPFDRRVALAAAAALAALLEKEDEDEVDSRSQRIGLPPTDGDKFNADQTESDSHNAATDSDPPSLQVSSETLDSIEAFSQYLPPSGRWFKALSVPSKTVSLFLRFAHTTDVKLPGAERRSLYYRRYGNPNYGGMTGILSRSYRRRLQGPKKKADSSDMDSCSHDARLLTRDLVEEIAKAYENPDTFGGIAMPVKKVKLRAAFMNPDAAGPAPDRQLVVYDNVYDADEEEPRVVVGISDELRARIGTRREAVDFPIPKSPKQPRKWPRRDRGPAPNRWLTDDYSFSPPSLENINVVDLREPWMREEDLCLPHRPFVFSGKQTDRRVRQDELNGTTTITLMPDVEPPLSPGILQEDDNSHTARRLLASMSMVADMEENSSKSRSQKLPRCRNVRAIVVELRTAHVQDHDVNKPVGQPGFRHSTASQRYATTSESIQNYDLEVDLSHQQNVDVSDGTSVIKLSCPDGSHWILPHSFPFEEENAYLEVMAGPDGGSTIRFRLSEKTAIRGKQRGLYECHRRTRQLFTETGVNATWERRSGQPDCCPCCPWFEQHHCIDRWDNHVSPSADHRQVFLYTGSIVNVLDRTMHPVVNEPMLVPCPGPFTDRGKPEFYAKSTPYQLSLGDTDQLPSIDYDFDPRFGLCLRKMQLQQTTLYIFCKYPNSKWNRMLRIKWPPPPPVLAPEVELQLTELSREQSPSFVQANQSGFHTSVDWNSLNNSLYRVKEGTLLRVDCVASYNDPYIVRQHPRRLCFRWKLVTLPKE
ncbi:hypothetical protein CSKR_112207, partial [Clonorchis sinensis]